MISNLQMHIEKTLECLTDEHNAGIAGPSGLRTQAIAHVRCALLLLTRNEWDVSCDDSGGSSITSKESDHATTDTT